MKKILMALVVGLVGLTACASAHSLGTAPSSSPSPSMSPSPSPTPSHKPKPPKPTPSPTKSSGGGTASCATKTGGDFDSQNFVGAQLVDIRVGSHDTYDRVTFEFSGQNAGPPFAIRPVTTVTEDGSGMPLSLRGTSFAEIVFQHASGFDLDGNPTYRGPSDFNPGFTVLAEARAAGDFERVLSWGFGLNHSNCWTVLELSNPTRLAVDFQH